MRTRLREEGGYALVTVLMVSTLLMVLILGVFATVDGAEPGTADDDRAAQARAAADAGVAFYASRLAADPDFWKKCADSGTDPLWSGTPPAGGAPWRAVDGADPTAPQTPEFTIEIVPSPGYTACEKDTPASVFESTSNALRVRATGRVGGTRRTVTAAYRRGSLLRYLYFTELETTDPLFYPTSGTRNQTWAAANCNKVYGVRSTSCSDIQFGGNDEVLGPMRTNDSSLSLCSNPQLGRRGGADAVEVVARGGTGWRKGSTAASCGDSTPTINTDPSPLSLPDDINANLKSVAATSESGRFSFKGVTTIAFNAAGNRVSIRDATGKTLTNVELPQRGVIYVDDNGCRGDLPNPATVADYSSERSCMPIAKVSGTIDKDLTIASDGDVLVTGDIRASASNPLIGLVARNFVRIYHPVKLTPSKYDAQSICWDGRRFYSCTVQRDRLTCENTYPGTLDNVTIDAAILSRDHSFAVDNYGGASLYASGYDDYVNCAKLQTLAVTGAIIQNFRGPVGTAGDPGTGYTKNYNYEDRLKVRNPPYFPQPQGSIWRTVRATETLPPANP